MDLSSWDGKRPIIGRTDIRRLNVHERKKIERINILSLVYSSALPAFAYRSGAYRLDATVILRWPKNAIFRQIDQFSVQKY